LTAPSRPPLCRASSAKPGSAFPDLEGAVMRFDAAVVVAAAHVSGEVVPARAQMAATLGFHIILACLGIAFPTIVLLAEFIGLRRHDEISIRLARRWSQAMGVLIAVGAVTGTVLSFEMGLLWPLPAGAPTARRSSRSHKRQPEKVTMTRMTLDDLVVSDTAAAAGSSLDNVRHGIASLPALSQVRGLTVDAEMAPAIGLEPITCRLTAGRSAD
jgi:hypothetical protein